MIKKNIDIFLDSEANITIEKIEIDKNVDIFLDSETSIPIEKIESDKIFSNVDLSIYKGKDGYTPIKGVDYFIEEDINALKEIFALKDHTHDNMGGSAKAICGTFKAGELKVGQGLDNKDYKNNVKWIDNVTPVNAENLNEIEDKLKAHQEILDGFSFSPLESNVHVGHNPPTNENLQAWVDTSDDEEFMQDISDLVLDEFRNIFSAMQEQISFLKSKNSELETRIYRLEMYGSNSSPTNGYILTLEDKTILTLEDGTILTLE